MLLLRKIDWKIQSGLALATLVSLVVDVSFSMAGVFSLGVWQVMSAVLNTRCFLTQGARKEIRLYWAMAAVAVACIVAPALVPDPGLQPSLVYIVVWLLLAFAIAVYYLVNYHRLLKYLTLQSELRGLLGSSE
jgi:hypothetical protein